jgi:hypothetical protein
MSHAVHLPSEQLLRMVEEAVESQEQARAAFNGALVLQAEADLKLGAVAMEIAALIDAGTV